MHVIGMLDILRIQGLPYSYVYKTHHQKGIHIATLLYKSLSLVGVGFDLIRTRGDAVLCTSPDELVRWTERCNIAGGRLARRAPVLAPAVSKNYRHTGQHTPRSTTGRSSYVGISGRFQWLVFLYNVRINL